MANSVTGFLLVASLVAASGLYVDEPLLYDTFPADFMWAAATSAHQIEGGWDADGIRKSSATKNELQRGRDLIISFPGKGLNIWDVYTTNTSNVLDGSNGQRACNSYNFYEKDIEALKSLGVRTFHLA